MAGVVEGQREQRAYKRLKMRQSAAESKIYIPLHSDASLPIYQPLKAAKPAITSFLKNLCQRLSHHFITHIEICRHRLHVI